MQDFWRKIFLNAAKCILNVKIFTYTDVAKTNSSYIALSSYYIEWNGANIYQKIMCLI